MMSIFVPPYGYCHCGCGKLTRVSSRNRGKDRIPKGQPQKYIRGHAMVNRKHSSETRERMAISQANALSVPSVREKRIAQVKVAGFQPQQNKRKSHIQKRTKTYYSFRKKMWERDGNACTGCGSRQRLHLHHFISRTDRPDLRFEPSNVTTLCHSCHMREEANIKHDRKRKGVIL